jgi:hypothetical protein
MKKVKKPLSNILETARAVFFVKGSAPKGRFMLHPIAREGLCFPGSGWGAESAERKEKGTFDKFFLEGGNQL